MTEKTAVYRHYDADGALLYVGLSRNPLKRWGQHKALALWFYDISRIEIQWFDSREEASDAEIRAVKSERPIFNTVHNTANPQRKKSKAQPQIFDASEVAPPALAGDLMVGVVLPDDENAPAEMVALGIPCANIYEAYRPALIDNLAKMMPPGSSLIFAADVAVSDEQIEHLVSREISFGRMK